MIITQIIEINNEILDLTGLVTTAPLNKAQRLKTKLKSDTTNLATKTVLNRKSTWTESKASTTSTLVRKTNYNTKITETVNIIADVSDFNTKRRSINTKVS